MRVCSARERNPELTVPFHPALRALTSSGLIHAATRFPSNVAVPLAPVSAEEEEEGPVTVFDGMSFNCLTVAIVCNRLVELSNSDCVSEPCDWLRRYCAMAALRCCEKSCPGMSTDEDPPRDPPP